MRQYMTELKCKRSMVCLNEMWHYLLKLRQNISEVLALSVDDDWFFKDLNLSETDEQRRQS